LIPLTAATPHGDLRVIYRRSAQLSLALIGLVAQTLPGQAAAPRNTAFTVDFGLASAAGNTSVSTLNFRDKFSQRSKDSVITFTQTFGTVYGKTDHKTSAESYAGQLRGDFALSPRCYLFALTGWDRNLFGGIERRLEETAGLGIKAVATPKNELNLELGLSLFQQKNSTAAAGGSLQDNYTAGRLGGHYLHHFTATSTFAQSAEFIPNFDVATAWRLNTETTFLAPISKRIGLKLSYLMHYDNLPPFISDTSTARLKKSDRFLTAGITISY
jgi:putative salt-induced outer membrane protein